jgi:outer membrane receptor protein involved in Fe transport
MARSLERVVVDLADIARVVVTLGSASALCAYGAMHAPT